MPRRSRSAPWFVHPSASSQTPGLLPGLAVMNAATITEFREDVLSYVLSFFLGEHLRVKLPVID